MGVLHEHEFIKSIKSVTVLVIIAKFNKKIDNLLHAKESTVTNDLNEIEKAAITFKKKEKTYWQVCCSKIMFFSEDNQINLVLPINNNNKSER